MRKRDWKRRAKALQGDVEHWTCMAGEARRREETLRRDYALMEQARDQNAKHLVEARQDLADVRGQRDSLARQVRERDARPAMDMAHLSAWLNDRRGVRLYMSDGREAWTR